MKHILGSAFSLSPAITNLRHMVLRFVFNFSLLSKWLIFLLVMFCVTVALSFSPSDSLTLFKHQSNFAHKPVLEKEKKSREACHNLFSEAAGLQKAQVDLFCVDFCWQQAVVLSTYNKNQYFRQQKYGEYISYCAMKRQSLLEGGRSWWSPCMTDLYWYLYLFRENVCFMTCVLRTTVFLICSTSWYKHCSLAFSIWVFTLRMVLKYADFTLLQVLQVHTKSDGGRVENRSKWWVRNGFCLPYMESCALFLTLSSEAHLCGIFFWFCPPRIGILWQNGKILLFCFFIDELCENLEAAPVKGWKHMFCWTSTAVSICNCVEYQYSRGVWTCLEE